MSARKRQQDLMRRIAAEESRSAVVPAAEALYARAVELADANGPFETLEARSALLYAAWCFAGSLRAATDEKKRKRRAARAAAARAAVPPEHACEKNCDVCTIAMAAELGMRPATPNREGSKA